MFTPSSTLSFDSTACLQEDILPPELHVMMYTDKPWIKAENFLTFLLKYYDCHIDLGMLNLPNIEIANVNISNINFDSCTGLENVTFRNVYLNLNQLRFFHAQGSALECFTVSYSSIYECLYQSYKVLVDPNSSFKLFSDELRKIQLVMILDEIIYDVETKKGKIERLNEVKEWINNIFKPIIVNNVPRA